MDLLVEGRGGKVGQFFVEGRRRGDLLFENDAH
jgi:hypothetical protein